MPIGWTRRSVGSKSSCRLQAQPFVGASLLAKIVNDNPGSLVKRGVLVFFASKLAPTEKQHLFSIYQYYQVCQSFTLRPEGCLSIMARFHFPAREPPRCCVSAKKL
ncbi:hypothetical protein C1Y30_06325 [Pseudomonas sp. GW704-F3]|nr:hypothetical protein C1Y30_06325 [Pseudomonas sp. GW704-F3]PMU94467.1 hypothetical protein C1Y28_16355 [Pseudomonas sp. GW704-F5]PMV02964.1 hypothetical protein C1Y29_15600 [Pseudomonas sp. MPBD4-3]PMV34435.1 hypothetical protein C1Y27_06450 [Pseudomonas sp. GW704-F2]